MPYDAVVIGSGPNGLSAALVLAQAGLQVKVIEGANEIGGGTRTASLTLPGFQHDFCSAVHPTGLLSPYWRTLELEKHGLEWIQPPASVAHPLDGEPAVILTQSLAETSAQLGIDQAAWEKLIRPFLKNPHGLLKDSLGPLGFPDHPIQLARFGLKAMQSATGLAKRSFKGQRARALFAGCAGHSVLPLDKGFSAAIGLMFAVMGHVANWPVARGGSKAISEALAARFRSFGGEIETQNWITRWEQLPPAKAYLFDTDPRQVAEIAAAQLPSRYRKRLQRYHYGPGVFKVDWALSESIPWTDPRCLEASTVHIGGTMAEINASERDAWEGRHTERPFVMLCQQSEFDPTRAPAGKQTGYAYCHVPHGSTQDMTEAIENQVERFAPGFKETILKRFTTSPQAFETYNPNYVGGAITGGAADISQLFTRPVARLNPYTTPHRHIYLCSASTPPGGGVHGMCGFHAAQTVLKRVFR